ncbi:MAG: hypothetical protein OHK0011_11920 [Turneriella sp.]
MRPELNLQIRCSECNDTITMTVARLTDDAEYALNPSDIRYLCPVCHIQAKNRRMLRQMVQATTVRT